MPFFYIMKKINLFWAVVLLCGCANLMHGQVQPVKLLKNNTYQTTCSGLAETMGSCYQKAKETCQTNFKALEEKVDSSGVHREMIFQCE